MAACGLILLGSGLVFGSDDRRSAEATIIVASVTQMRSPAISNPLDSRFQPDGLPVVVPQPRDLFI